MARDSSKTRRRLIAAADGLFYGQGIRAVGVDAVAEAAGVTKRTLYYHFASKDDPIAPISRNVICRPWAVTGA
jgi:AcrR family transcriptional regulator